MKKKLIRLTTVDLSLDKLLQGQLSYLSAYYDVIGVASDTGLLKKVEEREGIKVINVPMHREISLIYDFRSLLSLIKLFHKERPDILHCNTPKGSLLGLIAGKITGVPHRVYTVTGLRYQGVKGLFRFVLKTMERISCACATKVIPEGEGILHTLQVDKITRKPLSVLYFGNINGVDTNYYALPKNHQDEEMQNQCPNNSREILGYSSSDFVFVYVGRIVRDKGLNELAGAMSKLSHEVLPQKIKLLMVGSFEKSDPVNPSTEFYFKSSPEVKFVGWKDDIRPYLAAADTLVFPSYREGFPNVPMQAGAMGLPCIVTNINGCNEIIRDNLNGKIIQVKSEQALYNTMKWFVLHPEEVKRMSYNSRGFITSRYKQEEVWKATFEMYNNLFTDKTKSKNAL